MKQVILLFKEPRFLVTMRDKATKKIRKVKVSRVDKDFVKGVMLQGFKILDVRRFNKQDFIDDKCEGERCLRKDFYD